MLCSDFTHYTMRVRSNLSRYCCLHWDGMFELNVLWNHCYRFLISSVIALIILLLYQFFTYNTIVELHCLLLGTKLIELYCWVFERTFHCLMLQVYQCLYYIVEFIVYCWVRNHDPLTLLSAVYKNNVTGFCLSFLSNPVILCKYWYLIIGKTSRATIDNGP